MSKEDDATDQSYKTTVQDLWFPWKRNLGPVNNAAEHKNTHKKPRGDLLQTDRRGRLEGQSPDGSQDEGQKIKKQRRMEQEGAGWTVEKKSQICGELKHDARMKREGRTRL